VEGSGRGLILGTIPAFATKYLGQDSRSPGRNLNPGRPEYEAEYICSIIT
jgi:hypothetical protein